MKYSVSETAKMFGISVRTLHYYDEIGLVKPSEVSESGYRYYGGEALSTLQQVLFYRELELSLKEIAELLHNPQYDKTQTLCRHRELLLLKRKHLDELLRLVDQTIGGIEMSKPEITLADIQAAKEKYADEARERYGNTDQYRQSSSRVYTDEQQLDIAQKANEIFRAFSKSRDKDPSDKSVQELVRRWQDHITVYHYECTIPILSCLGQMYVNDSRFTQNIDRFGKGTAQFMSDAIRIYCAQG